MAGPMRELCIEANRENMQAVQDFVKEALEKNSKCTRKDLLKIHMVVDEVFGNISDYAYGDSIGPVRVQVDVDEEDEAAVLVFMDEGTPFDPLSEVSPDITAPASKRSIGGLGIFMVKNAMDDISYEYKDEMNVLTMKKRMGEKDA